MIAILCFHPWFALQMKCSPQDHAHQRSHHAPCFRPWCCWSALLRALALPRFQVQVENGPIPVCVLQCLLLLEVITAQCDPPALTDERPTHLANAAAIMLALWETSMVGHHLWPVCSGWHTSTHRMTHELATLTTE